MPPLLALLLLLLAAAAGFGSYLYSRRYGDARAKEMGLTPEQARTGPTDDGGATEFDRRTGKEILSGSFETADPEIQRTGRIAQRWTGACVALTILTIAVWVALERS